MTLEPKFAFYQEIAVMWPVPERREFVGRLGVILGRSQCEDSRVWLYAASMQGEEHTYSLLESELEATGRQFTRDEFFDGTSVRVSVDEHRRGKVEFDT